MTNALTTTSDLQMIPSTDEWSLMRDMASRLVPTGFLPQAINTPEKAVAIMLKGRELRIPPMQALSNISMVQGKPTVGAELMLALIYRDHGRQALRVKESDNQHCTIEYRTVGWEGTSEHTFTIEEARQAGLIKNGPWTQYPATMLRWRAISQVAKFAFPDSIGGMYVTGELGDDVTITPDGDVIAAPQFSATVVERPAANVTQLTAGNADSERAMKRIHAVAQRRGITHDMLHAKFAEIGYASLADVPAANLENLANRIEQQDNAFLEAEWKAFGWQPPADPETGEILDITPNNGPDLKTVKANLWQTVNGVWNWTVQDLDAIARRTYDKPVRELTAGEIETLHHELLLLNADERDAELTAARAAAA